MEDTALTNKIQIDNPSFLPRVPLKFKDFQGKIPLSPPSASDHLYCHTLKKKNVPTYDHLKTIKCHQNSDMLFIVEVVK